MYSVASSKFLALNSLIPYLGKIIFRAFDWTAASAKKTLAWFLKGGTSRSWILKS